MAVPESIQPLVERYTYHREAYLRGQEKYNESQLRQDFTDPFFHALGWDVNNNKGHSEAYREVLHEEPVQMQDASLDHEKELLARQVEATDASIDKLVYELYDLTPDEIQIVEGK
ncbi:MAG: hypothetical protein WCX22_12815 [Methanoregula sp.]